MLKKFAYLLIASVLVVFFINEVAIALKWINQAHNMLSAHMKDVFAGGEIGQTVRHSLSLFLIPVVIAYIPAGIYWVFKRKEMPGLCHIVLTLWVVLATSIAFHA